MFTGVVRRPSEAHAVDEFLALRDKQPSALILEGEPGIGKTTLWLAGLEQARDSGFVVLSAQATAAESVLAYTSLGDLLREVEAGVYADLPDPQRVAMDRVLLRGKERNSAVTDQRTVAAGFLSIVERLADESPVLIAIDDLQWLDISSRNALAFTARRLSGPVGLFGTVRNDPQSMASIGWLRLRRPDAIDPIGVSPLSLGSLHTVVSQRLGISLARPAMVRIHEISGGNPLYALELARTIHQSDTLLTHPSGTLGQLVQNRIGGLDSAARDVLLAAACIGTPTVEVVARAAGSHIDQVVELLEDAEREGIVAIDGHWLRFAHPLLAWGVYAGADPVQRRAMHRRLAEIIDDPELRARHLALAATHGDAHTLEALDVAAEEAQTRGAPAAAAELLDLALRLGADAPEHRIRLARCYFNAGDAQQARNILESTIDATPPSPTRAEALTLLGAIETIERSHAAAAEAFDRALVEAASNTVLAVQILIPLSFALYNTGRHADAARRADDAVAEAIRLGQPDLVSAALSMQALLRFWLGDGVDERGLRQAPAVEDQSSAVPIVYRPAMHRAMLLSFTGQLHSARNEYFSIRTRCVERGEESDLNFLAFHSVLNEVWRGDFAAATLLAEDRVEQAMQFDGDLHLGAALIMRAACAAYTGHEDDARRDAGQALTMVGGSDSTILTGWPTATLGFLEVSLGNYSDALDVMAPLLARFARTPAATEIYVASYLPDAAEALIALDRPIEAEPLVDALERNGRRLDRAWMLAVGARCRAMLSATRGDLKDASLNAERAMVEHERLPMPFECARTLLLVGQLQRRHRQREKSAVTLRQALDAFEELGTPLWANRVRAELARVNVGVREQSALLTPSEQRVAELVASGMTNREVAATLFISPKTVEVNLSRIYRKLGIRSRTQLGHMIRR